MRTLSATIPSALIASVIKSNRIRSNNPTNRDTDLSVHVNSHELAMDLVNRARMDGTLARMLFGVRSFIRSLDMSTMEDAVSDLYVDLCIHPYDPARGCTVSTWVGMWSMKRREYYRRQHMESVDALDAASQNNHEDRGGISHSQAFDRQVMDYARACTIDVDRLDIAEQISTAHEIVADLPDELRTVLLSSLDPTDSDKSLSERTGLSNVKISQVRAELREMGIESKRSRLH